MSAKNKVTGIFWLIFFYASPVIPLVAYFAGNWYTFFHSWSLAMTAGIFAFGYIMNQFILGSRPRFFDKVLGLDKVLLLHSQMGLLSAFLILAHLVIKNLNQFTLNNQVILGVLAALIFLLVIVVSLVFMTSSILGRVKAVQNLKQFTAQKLRVQYQHLRAFHNLTALAALFIALHVLLASSTSETWLRGLIMGIWFLIAMGFYLNHKILRPLRLRGKHWTVQKVVSVGPQVWAIDLSRPQGSSFNHRGGQFAFFSFFKTEKGSEEHPFTISSPPGSELVRVTAKVLGDWTARIPQISPGDSVAVDGPYGLFTLNRLPVGRPVVMIAGGIGITPFMSMLGNLTAEHKHGPLRLLWNARQEADLFASQNFIHLEQTLPRFRYTPITSGSENWPGPTRGLEKDLGEELKEPLNYEYFLCGPPPQMYVLIKQLKALGVRAKNIHFENFSM